MREWRTVTLGEISKDISYGYTESASNEPIGPKFLRITDIANGRLDWDNVPYCPITDKNRQKYLLHPGDIVIARTGATTGAAYTIKPNDPKDVVYASYLIRYQIDKKIADPFFVDFHLRSSVWSSFIDGIAGGSAQPGANAKELASFEFHLPSLPEQKAIAAVLSSLEDKIDLLHRQNATLEAMAVTLFRQWFVVEAKEYWDEKRMEDLCTITRGASPRPIIQYIVNGTVPWIKIADGSRSNNFFIDSTNEFIIEAGVSKSVKVYPGDLILSNSATCGFPYFVEIKGCIHDGWLLFRDFKGISKTFVFFFLKTIFNELNNIADGSVQNNLNTGMLKEYPIKLPPIDTMSAFDKQAETMIKKIRQNQLQVRNLEKLRDTLLPKLMSGDVRVRL